MDDREDDEPRVPVVLNPPKRIWLNVGELDEDTEWSAFHLHTEDMTWCSEQIGESDVEYVLVSELAAAHERIAQLARELDEALELNRKLDAGRDEALAQLTQARRDERERCAKICEAKSGRYGSSEIDPIAISWNCACVDCAAAIRAMQENERGS